MSHRCGCRGHVVVGPTAGLWATACLLGCTWRPPQRGRVDLQADPAALQRLAGSRQHLLRVRSRGGERCASPIVTVQQCLGTSSGSTQRRTRTGTWGRQRRRCSWMCCAVRTASGASIQAIRRDRSARPRGRRGRSRTPRGGSSPGRRLGGWWRASAALCGRGGSGRTARSTARRRRAR
jgi:hypothetical protein